MAQAARLGVGDVTVTSRTAESASRLADSYDARSAPLHELPDLLRGADMAVFCTGAIGTIVDRATIEPVMTGRDGPLVLVDLALPHDTDPACSAIPGVERVDLAALAERPEAHADRTDSIAAGQIVGDELREYFAARAARAVEPVLVSLRGRATAVVDAELERLRERLPGLVAEDWATIEQALRRTVNTLMHTPTVRIKQLAADPDGQRYADALNSLFDLSVDLVDTVITPRETPTPGEGQ